MRHAFSMKHKRIIDALDPQIGYKSYLEMGLRCPEKGCTARLYLKAPHPRREHTRKIPSGKTVEVKATEVEKHFACFSENECAFASKCKRKEKKELSPREIESRNNAGKNQRWSHISNHFLAILDGPLKRELSEELLHSFLSNIMPFQAIQEAAEDVRQVFSVSEIRYELKEKVKVWYTSMPSMKAEDIIPEHKKQFHSLVDWVKSKDPLELRFQMETAQEAIDFLAQPRARKILYLVVLRAIVSQHYYNGQQPTFYYFSREFLEEIVKAIIAMLCVARWAEDWDESLPSK